MDTNLTSNIHNSKLRNQRTALVSVENTRKRVRPIWLHLITIFFTKKMFYSAIKYGIAGSIMFQYTKLGFCLLILSAFVDHV